MIDVSQFTKPGSTINHNGYIVTAVNKLGAYQVKAPPVNKSINSGEIYATEGRFLDKNFYTTGASGVPYV